MFLTFAHFNIYSLLFVVAACQIAIFKCEVVFDLFDLKTDVILVLTWQRLMIVLVYEILFSALSMLSYNNS